LLKWLSHFVKNFENSSFEYFIFTKNIGRPQSLLTIGFFVKATSNFCNKRLIFFPLSIEWLWILYPFIFLHMFFEYLCNNFLFI
jgi:hypothetical protein